MKRTVTILILGIAGTLGTSCTTSQQAGGTVQGIPGPILAGGLGAAIGSAVVKSNPGTGIALGALAGYGAAKVYQNRKEEKKLELYNEAYTKGRSDSVKTLYWAQRNAQRDGADPDVEYRYMEVPVPSHVTSDGVFVDEHYRVIEVVE